jgi:Tol biopolymer transport system component
MTSSPLSVLHRATRIITYGFLLIVIVAIILVSSIFTILPPLLPNQLSAFATSAGENGKIAFSSTRDVNNQEIYVMNDDGSDVTRLTNNAARDSDPSWSPDGEKIAFQTTRDGDNEIFVMNAADGSDVTRLTNNLASDEFPRWSPDGEKITFQSNRDGNFEIYIMNAADGGNPTRLTNNNAIDGSPSWSPDAEKITFGSQRDGNPEIYVMNADGSGQTRLTNNNAIDGSSGWSPDGEKIVFDSTRDGNFEIYVMNAADGGNPTRLTNNAAKDFESRWSTDGEKIAFISTRDGNFEIYIMNAADGSGQTNITNHPAADYDPDFASGAATQPPEEDTTPPVITVPGDLTEEATGPNGAEVSFKVSAMDEVDGPTDVECDHNSGETFPIGETVVTCSAEDLAGNRADEKSFTITVQDTTAPDVEVTEASDRRNGRAIAEGSTTNMRYIEITFQATDAVGIESTECSLDGAAFTSCTSPVVYDRLSRSSHEFTVRSTDAAGNRGEDEFTWTVRDPSAAAPGRQ